MKGKMNVLWLTFTKEARGLFRTQSPRQRWSIMVSLCHIVKLWIAQLCNIYTVVLLSQFVNKTYQHYECTPERRVDPIRPRLHLWLCVIQAGRGASCHSVRSTHPHALTRLFAPLFLLTVFDMNFKYYYWQAWVIKKSIFRFLRGPHCW